MPPDWKRQKTEVLGRALRDTDSGGRLVYHGAGWPESPSVLHKQKLGMLKVGERKLND